MWGFPWMFWIVPLIIYAVAARRWRRWARLGPWGYPPHVEYAGRWTRGRGDGGAWAERRHATAAPGRELEGQQSYVDALETRVAELEARLDFTERLLAGRQETPPRQ